MAQNCDQSHMNFNHGYLIQLFITMGDVVLRENDPIMLGTLICSFQNLENQNLSIFLILWIEIHDIPNSLHSSSTKSIFIGFDSM